MKIIIDIDIFSYFADGGIAISETFFFNILRGGLQNSVLMIQWYIINSIMIKKVL